MLLNRKPRIVTLVIFTLLVLSMLGYTVITTFLTASYPFNVPQMYSVNPVPIRRALARRVLKVQRQIEFMAGKEGKIDSAWALELLSIVTELDPRVVAGGYEDNSNMTVESLDSLPKKWPVCPEEYHGRAADDTFQHNFVQLECTNVSKFKDVLTVILSTKRWEHDRTKFVVANIRSLYDVNIFILTYEGDESLSLDIDGTFIKPFPVGTSESYAINHVAATVETPFTLIADSLTHFTEQSSLERLVRVLDSLDKVSVASGAYRNLNGHWHYGCLQHRMENYHLAYARGYEHSQHECMYCDDVLGPFVVRTEILKKVHLTDSLEGSVMYRDWFLNIRLEGSLVMACPDVMFFVDAEPIMKHDDWLKISTKWSIQYVRPYDGHEIEFSCEEVKISCVNLMKSASSFLLPPCCRAKIRQELGYLQDCAEELGVYYELSAGSLLGAVKYGGILPWDFDTDVLTDCKDQKLWLTKGMNCMTRKGCRSLLMFGNYWTSSCEYSVLDVSCRYNQTIYLPSEYRGVPTQVEFNGRMTNVKPNPGHVSRNIYGPEYLKHAVHWRYSTDSKFPKDDGSGQVPGIWSFCKEPGFHSCLDHFPVDGNLGFKRFSYQLH
ncbi:uncharacterized protein [Panulirus ornatus]|uniref:uncharacterized protein isoform X1 n=2 Tax=Panulirus ornatus TaxID=150431 RepID=UPI003A89EBB2